MKTYTVELYKSALCPRCAYLAKVLKDLKEQYGDFEIITYDILTNPKAFKDENIKMIPAIKINHHKRSWLLPQKAQIIDFIKKSS